MCSFTRSLFLLTLPLYAASLHAIQQNKPSTSPLEKAPIPSKSNNASGIRIRADFLYWQAHTDGNFGIAIGDTGNHASNSSEPVTPSAIHIHAMRFEWDPGFRVGIGYRIPTWYWDLQLTWTHLTTSAKANTFASPPSTANVRAGKTTFNGYADTPMSNNLGFNSNGLIGAQNLVGHAHWHLDYSILNFELGRTFFVEKRFGLRPHLGLQAAWLEQKSKFYFSGTANTLSQLNPSTTSFSSVWHQMQDLWGVGARMGLDGEWKFNREFSIFGNVAFMMLLGNYQQNTTVSTDPAFVQGGTSVVTSMQKPFSGTDLVLGVRWSTLTDTRYRWTLELSWDNHSYFNTAMYTTLAVGELNVHGGTLTGKFEF